MTEEFCATTEPFSDGESPPNSFTHFMRNQRIDGIKDIKKTFSISDNELSHLLPTLNSVSFIKQANTYDLKIPENENFSEARISRTGELANDFSVASYLMLSDNCELINFNIGNHANLAYPVNLCGSRQNMLSMHSFTGLHKIVGGFEDLIKRMVSSLSSMKNVELQLNQRVRQVSEYRDGFSVTSNASPTTKSYQYTSKQVIFACGTQGLQYSNIPRPHLIHELTEKIRMTQGFKLFLTYKRAWWEDYGLHRGTVFTDLPNRYVVGLGKEGKSDTHATILAAYTNRNFRIFESLDCESLERFENIDGQIPKAQTPSKLLVKFVHQQLKLVLGKTVLLL